MDDPNQIPTAKTEATLPGHDQAALALVDQFVARAVSAKVKEDEGLAGAALARGARQAMPPLIEITCPVM